MFIKITHLIINVINIFNFDKYTEKILALINYLVKIMKGHSERSNYNI